MAAKHRNSQPLLLLALVFFCGVALLPSLVCGSRYLRTGFIVKGRVFCDTCRAGFETSVTTYISGAKVRVECRERSTRALKYSADGMTDASGLYKIEVADEHVNEICEAVIVSSPERGCTSPVAGRDRARIVLSHNNGIPSNTRLANSLGFQKDSALAGCKKVMEQYQQYDD